MSDVFKGLPRYIRIGAFRYRVLIGDEVKYPEMLTGCLGRADLDNGRIYLRETMDLQMAINVVQHELSHCIHYVYGVVDRSSEEHTCTQHTNGLVSMWIDNPKVFAWFNKSLRDLKKEHKADTGDDE